MVFTTVHADLQLNWCSFITKDHPAVVDGNLPSPSFGYALSSSDNVLYISSLTYDHEIDIESGAVHKLVGTAGSPLGMHPHNKLIHQGHIDDDSPASGDEFGFEMVTAKTQGDEAQLIVGVPGKTIDGIEKAGLIHYIQSICDDCEETVLTSKSFHQNTPGIIGGSERNDEFGQKLVAGDFNGDGFQDIAIGIPSEDIGISVQEGAVQIIMANGPEGLTASNNQFWSGNSTGLIGGSNAGDNFGRTLATGDFNGDGADDLAISIIGDEVDGVLNAGSVQVLYGVVESVVGAHDNGLSALGNQRWNQNSPGIAGGSESSDLFGRSLAAGDFNGDGVDDLAIGIPFENIGNVSNAGAVNIIYGSLGVGLAATGDLFISQDEAGFVGASEAEDFFGDGIDDLAIGATLEDISGVDNTGAVYIVHGSNTGLQFSDEYTITEGNLGGTQGLRQGAQFGKDMTIDDFDGDGKDDLAISTSTRVDHVPIDQVSVSVIYQKDHDSIYADGFEG